MLTAELLSSAAIPSQPVFRESDQLLTRREAAAYLRVTVNTLERWAAAGKGPPCHKVGGGIRYPLGPLRSFAGTKPAEPTAA